MAKPPARLLLAPLFAIQFFAWSSMFCLWIYALPVIGHILQHGTGLVDYQHLLILVSAGFAFYSVLGTCLSLLIPGLVDRFGNGVILGVGLLIGGGGFALLGMTTRVGWVWPAFAAIGIAWATLSSIPYAIASAAAPEGRGALSMRLFGFSTVLPQVVTTLGLALLGSSWFGAEIGRVMLIAAASMATAGLIALTFRRRFAVTADPW